MDLSGINFYDTSTWFINDLQRSAVREVVFEMADDTYQEECRYLTRFWWYLADYPYNFRPEELDRYVSPTKLQMLEELFRAIASNPEAVKDWIQKYRKRSSS